jgi:threonylcarbamoyladenosine tRNA methylthiotransferase MtaB
MPHFHIPLQSGSDEVLKLMQRGYDTTFFSSKIKKIKAVIPDAFIGVDVITGARGETDEYFEQTYDFIAGLDVTQLHVFTYSERLGTKALDINYEETPGKKHERTRRLISLSDEKQKAFYARHIKKVLPVLLEKSSNDNFMHGFTSNYIRVEISTNDVLRDNQIIPIYLSGFNEAETALSGSMVPISNYKLVSNE